MASNPIPYLFLIFLFIFGFGLSITKDFEDVLGDRAHSIRTIPVEYGMKGAAKIASILIIFSFFYILLLVSLDLIKQEFILVLLSLPLFIYLIEKMYKEPKEFYKSIGERSVARRIFHILMICLESS